MRQLAKEMNRIYQVSQNHPQLDKVPKEKIENKFLFIREKQTGILLNVRCDGESVFIPKYCMTNLSFANQKIKDFSIQVSIKDCGQLFTVEQVI
jgi:hypothetical protein